MTVPAEPRTAVVTGAASGIGAAIARRFALDGYRVIGVDRNPCEGVDYRHADLDDVTSARELAAWLRELQPDALISCAGIWSSQDLSRELDFASYDRMLRVNLTAPVLLMTAAGAAMAERGHGRIVAISSVHAQRAERGALAYDIGKAGLESAVRVLGLEWAHRDVLVNAVAPGFVRTPLSIVDGRDELEDPAFLDEYIAGRRLPIARAAEPDEIAEVVAFVGGPANTYMSGATIVVDGGLITRF